MVGEFVVRREGYLIFPFSRLSRSRCVELAGVFVRVGVGALAGGGGLMSSHHRSSRAYQTLRAEFRAECEEAGALCWLCGLPIEYGAGQYDEDAFELDHFFPVSTHPEKAEDPQNFRPSHRRCNQVRGNGAPRPGLGATSVDWFAGFGR